MFEVNNTLVYSEDTAIEMLHGLGMDAHDIEKLKWFLCGAEIEDARDGEAAWKQEYDAQVAMCESYNSAICEALNICDEALSMDRISKARDRFEGIKAIFENME